MRLLRIAVACLCAATPAWAQQEIRVDLAATGNLSQSIEPGTVVIRLDSRLPQGRYDISVRRELIPVAVLSAEGIGTLATLRPKLTELSPGPCEPLVAAVQLLNGATTESQVPARRAAVQALLTKTQCPDPATLADATAAVESTTQMLTPISVDGGERLLLTITRQVSEGTSPTWNVVLETEPRGEWITTYGVAFIPDDEQRFFTKSLEGGKFQIVRERDENSLRPVPSLFFSWLSAKSKRRDWSISPTGGFGLADNSPAVFGGVSVTFNQNIAVVGGVAVAADRRLQGRYSENQQISENLTDDQLHRQVFRASPMVALTFRFGRNPFGDDRQPPASVPAPAPAPPADTPPPPSGDGTAATTPAGTPSTEAAVRDPDIRLRFDAAGKLLASSDAALAALLQRAQTATDVFIVSHGWWNNEASADCFYRRMLGGLRQFQPAYLTGDRFRPLFVTIYWPSAVFPMQPADCDAGAETERREVASSSNVSPAAIRRWAIDVFPDAASRPGFDAELRRLTALLDRDANTELTTAESDELAATLVRWKQLSASDKGNEESEAELFSGSATDAAERWRARPDTRRELSLPSAKWLNFANAFTFWTMKERAGIVGSRGVYDVVKALQPLRERTRLRVHLVGHSFGGKLLTAALTGHRTGAANRADSLILLQAAFSQFAFASLDQIKNLGVSAPRSGLYVDVVNGNLVSGAIVVTHSSADLPNRLLYPAGVALVDDVVEAARVARFGSLGAAGIRGPQATSMDLSTQALRDLDPATTRVNVDASSVILGHSDLIKPQVFGLIWDAFEFASAR